MSTTKSTVSQSPKIIVPRRADSQSRCPCRCNPGSGTEISRRYIGLAIVALVAGSAIASIWEPAALTILERLLPTLTLMCGYYYGQRQT